MKTEIIENGRLNESYYRAEHPSGLTILVLTKPDYTGSHAIFAAKYGSIDTKIQDADGAFRDIPAGTAHFLEHKLFESEDLDAFERFAKTGAYANAFTSFDRTAYIFSCSQSFKENLEILLDFVQSPYFSEETVRKEQGIIGQEIRMYKDVAGWQVMFNLLGALYHENSVKIDIAGTEESIAGISADMLYGCYKNFYSLRNMVLAVAGNVTPEDVLEVADRLLKAEEGKAVQREFKREPAKPARTYVEESLAVSTPNFLLGYKEDISTPERSVKESLCTEIIHEVIAGKSSPLYKRLLEDGLINAGFSFEHFAGYGFACSFFGGESAKPQETADEIKKEVARIKETGISGQSFERARRKLYGGMVMMYNDVEDIARDLMEAHFSGTGLFDTVETCVSLTLEDVNGRLREILDGDTAALSIINPIVH
ncbi:MAG: insulinase family protein [Oscillospiraceae bacterium]|nr:insulinase family protein [Oscillospiraceae bacterium]